MHVFQSARGDAAGGDVPVSRIITDDRTGAQWVVRECDASHQPGARAPRYLCFDSSDTRRRVWRYPQDWPRLPDEALIDLSERRP